MTREVFAIKRYALAHSPNRENQERLGIRNGVFSINADDVNPAKIASVASTPDLRKEVLRLVAPRDRSLTEEFLEKLKESQEKEETKPENSSGDLWELPDAAQQRLSLAEGLLREGNLDRALG